MRENDGICAHIFRLQWHFSSPATRGPQRFPLRKAHAPDLSSPSIWSTFAGGAFFCALRVHISCAKNRSRIRPRIALAFFELGALNDFFHAKPTSTGPERARDWSTFAGGAFLRASGTYILRSRSRVSVPETFAVAFFE